MSRDWTGKTVAITGAAGAIGADFARSFAARGADVVLGDLDEEAIDALADEIGCRAYRMDASFNVSVENFVAFAKDAYERPVDLYISNAGIADAQPEKNACGASDAVWMQNWQVNLMGTVYAARELIPRWVKRGEGRLVIVASAAGLLSQIENATYSVTKHAAVGLAESIAITHRDDGIKVHCVCPQYVRSNMTKDFQDHPAVTAIGAGFKDPEDVTNALHAAIEAEKFLVLSHPEVEEYLQAKAENYDKWIGGMSKLRRGIMDAGGFPF